MIYILEQNVCRVEEWLVTCNEIMLLNYKINVIVFSCITEVKCAIQLVTNQIKRKLLCIDKVIRIKSSKPHLIWVTYNSKQLHFQSNLPNTDWMWDSTHSVVWLCGISLNCHEFNSTSCHSNSWIEWRRIEFWSLHKPGVNVCESGWICLNVF